MEAVQIPADVEETAEVDVSSLAADVEVRHGRFVVDLAIVQGRASGRRPSVTPDQASIPMASLRSL